MCMCCCWSDVASNEHGCLAGGWLGAVCPAVADQSTAHTSSAPLLSCKWLNCCSAPLKRSMWCLCNSSVAVVWWDTRGIDWGFPAAPRLITPLLISDPQPLNLQPQSFQTQLAKRSLVFSLRLFMVYGQFNSSGWHSTSDTVSHLCD